MVHGPLSALVALERVEQWAREAGRGAVLRGFEYRAVSPMYVDRRTEVYGKLEDGGVRVWVVQDGTVGMMARAEFE